MRFFFDHQTFSLHNYGGLPRYFSELISGINTITTDEAYLPLLYSNTVHLKDIGYPVKPFLPDTNIPRKEQILYNLNKANTIYKLRNKSFDVFHATYYDPYFVPYLRNKPFVVSFLDMIHERFSDQYNQLGSDQRLMNQKREIAQLADRIIAISESTKRDVVELLNIAPAKIDVIYLGSSLKPISGKIANNSNHDFYLLFVGRRELYKNFEGLLTSIHPLLKKYKLKLYCAGGGPFSKNEHLLLHSLGLDNLVEYHPISSDNILQELYRKAIAFIFPTLYEGFGIPVLEAFACDCPCIVSDLSSLPEVAGEAALYINPTIQESILNAVERLLHDSELRQSLIMAGREQLNKFSWQHTVTQTVDLYKSIT